MTDEVTILLSQYDAELFKAFQRRYDVIRKMEAVGAFSMKSGTVTLSFDAGGILGSVALNQVFHKFD